VLRLPSARRDVVLPVLDEYACFLQDLPSMREPSRLAVAPPRRGTVSLMKGIIFNLLEMAVSSEHGEDTWDALLDAAGLEGAYTSLGSYPDADLLKLVEAAASALKKPTDAILRWLGQRSVPVLADSYPQFFVPHSSTRSFLLTLNEVIHPEVRKLYPGADVPVFDFDTSSHDAVVLGYQSHRKLCQFGEGLIEGGAAHFGEAVAIEQPLCMNRGDAKCVLRVTFSRRAS
jgi:hypothetical protein